MSDLVQSLYIADMGAVTALGDKPETVAAAVSAGISGYQTSGPTNKNFELITMTGVPAAIYDACSIDINIKDYYSELYDRVVKMAVIAARQACRSLSNSDQVPIILAMPEDINQSKPYIKQTPFNFLIDNLANQNDIPISPEKIRAVKTGRAAGLQAIELAAGYLQSPENDYVLVGASDSFWSTALLNELDEQSRLKTETNMDGFVPGEGAVFLLLTNKIEIARDSPYGVIELINPASAQETGHLLSDKPYLGDGLSKVFNKTFTPQLENNINRIYSSMNGENFWAKEMGVAITRNQKLFSETYEVEHPADCYGDLGSATGLMLTMLSALKKRKSPTEHHLVYASSDGPWRSAVITKRQS